MPDLLQCRLAEIGAPADVCALAAELAEQAVRDPLTGLYNRRFFDEAFAQQTETARRYHRELSLVLLDIDGLKQINDTFGHEAGDNALKTFARLLGEITRKADIVCRIGGDEFAILMPETALSSVWKFTERFFQCLEKTGGPSTPWKLSASAGIAALPSDNLFADADRELLDSKPAHDQKPLPV
ncbi:MAG: GGDEF domain-containing protein [Pontiellaceae bacterium]|jgi:diguanylate cyclase (GGDEF)-like protein|nr:GGDEF domain-containing protein [Pontiellaceae bacterium]